MNYTRFVWEAKDHVTQAVAELSREKPKLTIEDLAMRIDVLNKTWDDLTDFLGRQREVRDETIEHLQNQLAEERKAK